MNYDAPNKSTDDAKEEEKDLKKEGNAFANTRETRPLSKAIAKEEEKEEPDGDDR